MIRRPNPTRRQLLQSALAAGCAAALPPLARAAAGTAATSHGAAADAARRLAGNDLGNLAVLLPAGSEGNVAPIAREFERRTGIGITIRTAPVDDINSVILLSRLTGRRQYDVVLPATYGIPDLAEADALLPLSDFAARYEPDGYQQASLYSVGDYYLGKLYGYQADGDVYLMFYNAAFLENADARARYEARFGEPLTLPRTWPDLDRLLAFFHEPAKGQYGGALFRTPRYIAWEWWMRYHSKGAMPFDADMRPLVDSAAGIAALTELTAASEFLSPDCDSNDLLQNWQAFTSGNIFCNIGWGGSQKYFQAHSQNFSHGLVYSHAPGGDNRGEQTVSFFNWGWNYAVPKNSRQPEIAYLFALFAASPAMSTLAVRQPDGFFDPIREAHYADPDIQAVYSGPFLEAHRDAMQRAVPDLYLRGQSEYFEILSDFILQADRRLLSPGEAMQSVAKLWNATTDRLGRAEQVRQWRALRARYPAPFAPA